MLYRYFVVRRLVLPSGHSSDTLLGQFGELSLEEAKGCFRRASEELKEPGCVLLVYVDSDSKMQIVDRFNYGGVYRLKFSDNDSM